ncbi:MAG: leucine-rich repeat domain-containing protein [Clostridia bacterium]|nr:leucine-rich repeat domain-containing protein [Clostridia bacterium]
MKHNRTQTQSKRILSILLAILMIAVSAPVVFGLNVLEVDKGNTHWVLDRDNKTLTVTGSGAMPAYPWNQGSYKSYIHFCEVGNGITTVGDYCFSQCTNLTSVSLPSSLREIGLQAFRQCTTLETIILPENVTYIGKSAFSICYLLSNVILPDSVLNIDDSAFYECKSLKTISLPENLLELGNSVFHSCRALESVILPNKLSSVGNNTFYGCEKLKSIILPDSVKTVGYSAFNGCSDLSRAVFSNSVTEIANNTFRNCSSLTSFLVPNRVETIESSAFYGCSNLREVSIPKSVTTISTDAFSGCSRLKDVYYEGTEDEWSAIAISSGNNNLKNATIHFEADPSIWVPQGNGIYNLGEETYSFKNYGDMHSPEGHCFGMSMTSSGYYNNYLNMNIIGDSRTLYDYDDNGTVRAPICHYQDIQGSYARAAVVAGGSRYFGDDDLDADWDAALDYVRDHEYDDKGKLVIGFFIGDGGHAVNFLRYEEVDGEERIYAYDNNFPEEETYFYKDADGWVLQTPKATFSERIRSFSLLDAWTYFQSAQRFNKSRVVYAKKGEVSIDGAVASEMVGAAEAGGRMMYELPDTAAQVRIIPQTDGATFTYLEKEYRFDAVDTDTYGVLTLSATEDGTGTLVIENAPTTPDTPDTPEPEPQNLCPWCGQEHVGFFAGLIAWFHGILARIFGARY